MTMLARLVCVALLCVAGGVSARTVVFGANHKTGSVLLAHIEHATARCDIADTLRFNSHFAGVVSPNNTYVVMVRNPFQMIVSGYLYHRKGPEPWTVSSIPKHTDVQGHHLLWTDENVVPPRPHESYSEYLRRLPPIEGILAEMVRCEYREFTNARVVAEARDAPNVLMICLDDMMWSEAVFHQYLEHIFTRLELPSDCADTLHVQLEVEGPEVPHPHGTHQAPDDRDMLLHLARMLDVTHFNETVALLEREIGCDE